MLESIKASKIRVRWNLREFHRVTEWKAGCVYRTRTLGMVVCTPEYADALRVAHKNLIVGPVSTRITKLVNG